MKKAYRTLSLSKILYAAMLVAFVGVCLALFTMKHPAPNMTPRQIVATKNVPAAAKPVYTQDKELLAMFRRVATNPVLKTNLVYSKGMKADSQGDYSTNVGIRVRPGRSLSDTTSTVAHEYMHHVFANVMSTDEWLRTTTVIKPLLESDGAMMHNLSKYGDGAKISEAFAYYCTENSDQYLSKELLTICNKYINRDALVMLR